MNKLQTREMSNADKSKNVSNLINKIDVEAAEFIITPDVPAQRMAVWFAELVCLVAAFVAFAIIGIILSLLKVSNFESALGMAALGVGGALIVSALIAQIVIGVRASSSVARSYYMRTPTDFVSVTETSKYAAVYADGVGYLVENGCVKSFTRDEFLSDIEGKSSGIALILTAPRKSIEYDPAKKGEVIVFTDDNKFDQGAFFVNGELREISTVGKRTLKHKKRNYVRTVKTPIALCKTAENYKILLSEQTANAIAAAGYELNRDYFEVKEIL